MSGWTNRVTSTLTGMVTTASNNGSKSAIEYNIKGFLHLRESFIMRNFLDSAIRIFYLSMIKWSYLNNLA